MPKSIIAKDLIIKAKEAEGAKDFEQASEMYERILNEDNLEVEAYDRLMIVYRKLKDYMKELSVIDRGISAYQDFYRAKITKSKKVVDLSNKLAKSIGLLDTKGNTTYDPEPIGKWKKRRLVVEKRGYYIPVRPKMGSVSV